MLLRVLEISNFVQLYQCQLSHSLGIYKYAKASEARVLHFAKRTRTGYCAGTGTRTVRTHEVPVFFFFLKWLGTRAVLPGY